MQELGFIIGAAAIALFIGYGIRSLQNWRKNRRARNEQIVAETVAATTRSPKAAISKS
tara:strand:+ start:1509 stop:1682 length:174 start_codon:yes stop_codon:yes gene_type:complete